MREKNTESEMSKRKRRTVAKIGLGIFLAGLLLVHNRKDKYTEGKL